METPAKASMRWSSGSRPPLKNHKNIGFLNNTAPDPLKSQSYQASIQCWAIIGMPEKRNLNGVSLAGQCWTVYSGILILTSLINKRVVKFWPPLTKLTGSAHGFSIKMEGFDTAISYTYCSCKWCKWVWPLMLLSHLGEYVCEWAYECYLAPICNDRKTFVSVRKHSWVVRKHLRVLARFETCS